MKKSRNVAIAGIGQTRHRGHREDINIAELVSEAVEAVLADSMVDISDIDAIVHGNMELFEGVHQPDMWHVIADGGYGKAGYRITTGGTTGATLVSAADHLVASGAHDLVLAIGFEKQEEGMTTTGITNMSCPLWDREVQTGAITGTTGVIMMNKYGQKAEEAAAELRVLMATNARRNFKAHLQARHHQEGRPGVPRAGLAAEALAHVPRVQRRLRDAVCLRRDGKEAAPEEGLDARPRHGPPPGVLRLRSYR